MEPEVVATSPCRIKSPMPVCCGFDSMRWWAREDLHSQGCSDLSRTGLLFPVNHTPVGAPGLAPGRLSDLKSLGSAVPSEARRREMICAQLHHRSKLPVEQVPLIAYCDNVDPSAIPICSQHTFLCLGTKRSSQRSTHDWTTSGNKINEGPRASTLTFNSRQP